LVVLPYYGGGFGDGGVEDLPHKLPEVESLLGGISHIVVLGFTIVSNTVYVLVADSYCKLF
jgi:hypothetical protein